MIRHIKTYQTNTIALAVDGGVSVQDVDFFEEAFAQKLREGHTSVNILLCLDKLNVKETSLKAAWQERVWGIRNVQQMGRIALLADTKNQRWLKTAINLEGFILMKLNPRSEERYYDIKDLDKAFAFIEGTE